MPRTRLHLRLRPLSDDGSTTWISLSGPLPTKTGAQQIRRLIAALAICTSEPMRVALSAGELGEWREAWLRHLMLVPERHREIRLRARRRRAGDPQPAQLDFFGGAR